MAFDEHLADRVRRLLERKSVSWVEKKMMGGLCFMVDDKMCFGISQVDFMARVGLDAYGAALKRKGCREMDFTGRPMKGFVFVDPTGYKTSKQLDHWVQLCLDFDPLATSSKKNKKAGVKTASKKKAAKKRITKKK